MLSSEDILTVEASGRILAQEIISPVNVPNFDRSAMDGYALNAESTFGASTYNPLMFRIVGQVTPGETYDSEVQSGNALSIMTGAPLPKGTNAVLIAENAEIVGDPVSYTHLTLPTIYYV